MSISRDPALVRTVRLVAAAVARRTGRDEDFVEEVRLAVGEACALLLGPSKGAGSEPVTVAMRMDGGLAVDVSSDVALSASEPPDADLGGTAPWLLLRSLIDDVRVHQDGVTTRVSMSWPNA